MPLIANLSQDEMYLVEILRHPVLCSEFIKDLDLSDDDEPWKYEIYQEEILCDFSTYVSLRAARSVGKTEVLIFGRTIWYLVNNFYPDPLLFTAPNKVHLQVPFDKLTKFIKSNKLLQNYVERSGINNSDYIIRSKNGFQFIGRIAGKSGSGINIIGLHIPFIIIDECIVGTQKVKGKNTNKFPRYLKPGDTVLSWNGENIEEDRIKSIQKIKRNQRVLEIKHKNGKLKVGENHRIYTDNGYKQANELVVGENIYTYKGTTKKFFESWEIDFIKEEISKSVSVLDIAKSLCRTPSSIFGKLDKLGLNVREIFDSVNLTEEEYQIILGSSLGDGSIQSEIKRARYTTNHSLKQKNYVDWLISKLQRIVRTKARISKNGGWGTYNYSFGTIGHPKILEIFNELYIKNKKTVTRKYLDKLSPLALAVWFMDDGSKAGMFSTHSFSKEENEIIKKWLIEKYNIDAFVRQDKSHPYLYYILIRNHSLETLRELIKPYIPECMQYKIGNGKYNDALLEIPEEISEDVTTLIKSKVLDIRDVWRAKAEYLYSIEVEKNHNYFVNDVLTKNSGYYPYGTFLELMPTFNTFQDGCQMIIAGTPDGRRDRSVNYYADEIDPEFSKHRVSAYENPRFSEEDEKQAIIRYGGKESEDFAHYVCFVPETKIFTKNGLKRIDSITNGDIVLTHKGNWKKVLSVINRDYGGEVLKIRTEKSSNSIICTPDHPIHAKKLKKVTWGGNKPYALWKGNLYKNIKPDRVKPLIPEFILASELTNLDRVAFPITELVENLPKFIDFSKYGDVINGKVFYRSGGRNKSIRHTGKFPLRVELTNEMLFFLGLYIAEGSSHKIKGQVCLSLNKKETHLIDKCFHIIQDIFNINCYLQKTSINGVQIVFNSRIFAEFAIEHLGHSASNKHIPEFLMGVPLNKILPLVEGMFAGDGSCREHSGFSASYCTVSETLSDQLEFLFKCSGLNVDVHEDPEKYVQIYTNKHITKTRKCYILTLNQQQISSIYNNKVSTFDTFDTGELAISIKNITKDTYKGKVYNLVVEDDNSYVTSNFSVHNCGEHGNPVFSMFSRENMLIEQYPIFAAKYKGKDFMGDPHFINQILSSMPPLPNFYEQVIFGVDLGYVEPTEIHILYQTKGRWYFHSRIELGQVDYPLQEKLLDLLDSKFNPSLIGIDEGGVGKNFVQHLLLDDAYINKTYANRLLPIKFGGTVVIGLDENGEEIKVKTKQVGMQRLQSATNNKEICYSSQDEELISELERTTYSKTAAGEIQYFTESADGSNRNDDHNIAALMCAILAWYTKNEVSLFQPIEKKLLNKFQWWTT